MIRTNNNKNTFQILCILIVMQLSGCITHKQSGVWPSTMPPQSLFVEAFLEQFANKTNTDNLNNHLVWIKRFYQGSFIYSLGWNKMTANLLETIGDSKLRDDINSRMYDLGLVICIEWAQDNSSRKIDSKAIAVWGNALRTASELNQQSIFVSKVESDVILLLNGNLNRKQIFRERYYPTEDYDNF